jgi:hypothetical protein
MESLLNEAVVVHGNGALEAAKLLDELQLNSCQLAIRLEL